LHPHPDIPAKGDWYVCPGLIENSADQPTTIGSGLASTFTAGGCTFTQVFRQGMIAIYARAYLKQPRPKLSTEERIKLGQAEKIIEEMFGPPRQTNSEPAPLWGNLPD
jgi:hypothetical protein